MSQSVRLDPRAIALARVTPYIIALVGVGSLIVVSLLIFFDMRRIRAEQRAQEELRLKRLETNRRLWTYLCNNDGGDAIYELRGPSMQLIVREEKWRSLHPARRNLISGVARSLATECREDRRALRVISLESGKCLGTNDGTVTGLQELE